MTFRAIAAAVLLLSGSAALASEREDKAQATRIQALVAPYSKELAQMSQLMFSIGACERHLRPRGADHFIGHFMEGPVPAGLEGFWKDETQKLFTSMYALGRSSQWRLNLDADQCSHVVDDELPVAQAAIDARIRRGRAKAKP